MKRYLGILFALVLALSFSLVPAVPAGAAGASLSGYQIITSPEMSYGDGGWGGWSVPAGKVVLGGGFYATAPVAASAPGTPNSVWPHYTYGSDEYGWVVRDAVDGVPNTITIYAICADEPAGYEVLTSATLNYSDGGWAGHSVPNGKVVLGGGFVLSDPWATPAGAASVSVPGTPDSVWPHYTYGDEYGWVVRAAVDGVSDPNSRIYVIYADEPAGYEVLTSAILNYSDGGWAGHSVPNGKVVLGGGFNLTGGPASVSVPGTPGSVWSHYTYGDEYGWVVRDAPDGATSYGSMLYVIYAFQSGSTVGLTGDTPEITAISATPTTIDFGTILPGDTPLGPDITVSNVGTVTVVVDATVDPVAGVFQYLKLKGGYSPGYLGFWDNIISSLNPNSNTSISSQLVVPSTYSAQGSQAATLIFEATAK